MVRRFDHSTVELLRKILLTGAATIGSATITFWMRDDLTPWNLDATFTVSYNTMSDSTLISIHSSYYFAVDHHLDISHTTQKTYKLPLKLVARSVQQLPSAATAGQCKLTLGANKPVVDLSSLFSGTKKALPKPTSLFPRFFKNWLWETIINKV